MRRALVRGSVVFRRANGTVATSSPSPAAAAPPMARISQYTRETAAASPDAHGSACSVDQSGTSPTFAQPARTTSCGKVSTVWFAPAPMTPQYISTPLRACRSGTILERALPFMSVTSMRTYARPPPAGGGQAAARRGPAPPRSQSAAVSRIAAVRAAAAAARTAPASAASAAISSTSSCEVRRRQ